LRITAAEGPGELFPLVKNHGVLIQIDGQGGKVFRCRALALGFEDGLQDAFEHNGIECRCFRLEELKGSRTLDRTSFHRLAILQGFRPRSFHKRRS